MKKIVMLGAVGVASAALASGFDAVEVVGQAQTTVVALATAIGALLAAAATIYAGFLGYRKFREAIARA